jgi:uncharacterized membrane protein YkoI
MRHWLAFLICMLGAVAPAWSAQTCNHFPGDFEGDIDQEGARAAVNRGDAAPFEEILRKARPQIHGEIMGQKLEQHHGEWLYEFRVVDGEGHMRYLHFGARTGQLRDVERLSCASS